MIPGFLGDWLVAFFRVPGMRDEMGLMGFGVRGIQIDSKGKM